MGAVTFNEAIPEVSVATIMQRFAMSLSRMYDIGLDSVLSTYLLQYSSSLLHS